MGRLHRNSNDWVHYFSDDNEISKTDSSSSAEGTIAVIKKIFIMFLDINIAQQFVSRCGNERIFVEVIFFLIFRRYTIFEGF